MRIQKNLLALFLCLALALGGMTIAIAEEEPVDDFMAPYDEPVKITWGVQSQAVQQFFDGDTYQDSRWTRLIKDRLNIDVEVVFSADNTTDAYNNRMNVLLASGDFPDVMRYDNRVWFKQAQEAGYIQSIEDVYNKYASDAVKAYREKYPESYEGASIDGQLYGIPYTNDNYHQGSYLWIRDDWLENLNAEPPRTIEEMIELARRFTFEDPDGNGVDDTYGLGLQANVMQYGYASLMGLAAAYGVPAKGNNGVFYRDDEGKMTFSMIQPGMKEALRVAHQMYEEGLIDPEFTAENTASLEEDVTTGKLGMMYHAVWGTWHPFNYTWFNDGVITRPHPIPTAEGYEPKMGIDSNMIGDLFVVGANCEHPEAIIKILNLFVEVYESENPEDFDYYWSNEQYRLCPIYINVPSELYSADVIEALRTNDTSKLTGNTMNYYNWTVGFADGSMADNTNAYGTWGYNFLEGDGGSMVIAEDYRDKGYFVTNVMAGQIPEIWVQNSSVLGDMVDTTFVDIIVGNRPVDDFDQFVDEWLAAGGQQTLDELDVMYPAE